MSALLDRSVRPVVKRIYPLEDARWDEFVGRSANSSVFHTRAWLEALHRTYGYQPVVFTTSRSYEALENCLLFCRVDSWATGRRLVSLPFSDHCAPLISEASQMRSLLAEVEREVRRDNLDYLELRVPGSVPIESSLPRAEYSYCFHHLDMSPDLPALFGSMHKDSTQRKIRRAEREDLVYREGRSDSLLDVFYELLMITRRRHRVPPQPRLWFQNLTRCMGDQLKIRVAFAREQPAAAMLTLSHKDTLVYKYGGSDERFHHLGAVHLLFWRCIQEAKEQGMRIFDLGRSDFGNLGLLVFKDRWGAARSTLTYSRFGDRGRIEYLPIDNRGGTLARYLVTRLPDRLFESVGRLVYPHIG